MTPDTIPSFFLYGEEPRSVEDRFLHVEDLDDRSRPSNWNIRPHAHTDLNHIFYISAGGGRMRAEAEQLVFSAPCLLLVPARAVHGFIYQVDTTGSVLTVSERYLCELVQRSPEFASLFAAPLVLALTTSTVVQSSFEQLAQELSWTAPGHAASVEALLLRLLVEGLRLAHHSAVDPLTSRGAQARLVARFRELVEQRYHLDEGLQDYATALGTTVKGLRSACNGVAHKGPLRILQDRIVLEAKRLMLYSDLSIAEIGYDLGFGDPAYFSRFFKRTTGLPPSSFRNGAVRALSL